jgi:small subunit ribosomal protein S15
MLATHSVAVALPARRAACLSGSRVRASAPVAAPKPRSLAVVTVATAKSSRPPMEDVADLRLHATDTGSAEVQTALLTQRIANLTEHLKVHDTDYACQRGLRMLLGQRTRLLRYVYDQDKARYFNLVADLGIRKKAIK